MYKGYDNIRTGKCKTGFTDFHNDKNQPPHNSSFMFPGNNLRDEESYGDPEKLQGTEALKKSKYTKRNFSVSCEEINTMVLRRPYRT